VATSFVAYVFLLEQTIACPGNTPGMNFVDDYETCNVKYRRPEAVPFEVSYSLTQMQLALPTANRNQIPKSF